MHARSLAKRGRSQAREAGRTHAREVGRTHARTFAREARSSLEGRRAKGSGLELKAAKHFSLARTASAHPENFNNGALQPSAVLEPRELSRRDCGSAQCKEVVYGGLRIILIPKILGGATPDSAMKVLPHEESSPYGFGCDWHVAAKIKTRPRRRRKTKHANALTGTTPAAMTSAAVAAIASSSTTSAALPS